MPEHISSTSQDIPPENTRNRILEGLFVFFFGRARERCSKLELHEYCHIHDEVPQSIILFWASITTFCSYVIFLFSLMPRTKESGTYDALVEMLTVPQEIVNSTGSLVLVLISLVVFFSWMLFVLFVCRRRFTSLMEYVVISISTPAATFTFIRPFLL